MTMASRTLLMRTRPQGLVALSRRIKGTKGKSLVRTLASSAPKSAAAPILASHAHHDDHESTTFGLVPLVALAAAVVSGAAYSRNSTTSCEAATATWSSADVPLRNTKTPPPTRQSMQPRNVMLHRMRSVRGRNLEDKYNVDWSTVLGEGAYGSVHPARLSTTGEKVSHRFVLFCRGCAPR